MHQVRHCIPESRRPEVNVFTPEVTQRVLFPQVWARTKVLEWRCVEDDIRRRKVSLQCENGETRSYRIKVVKSCKCKRYMKLQNQSLVRMRARAQTASVSADRRQQRRRRRRRKQRKDNVSPDHLLGRTGDDL